jgi:hypothetical protein
MCITLYILLSDATSSAHTCRAGSNASRGMGVYVRSFYSIRNAAERQINKFKPSVCLSVSLYTWNDSRIAEQIFAKLDPGQFY